MSPSSVGEDSTVPLTDLSFGVEIKYYTVLYIAYVSINVTITNKHADHREVV
jgi:hypothetical protein